MISFLVSAAFQSICLQVNTYPHILQTDNGGEFKGELDLFIEAHNITAPHQRINHVFTQTYSPTSNGLVERLNQELRRKIRMGCIRTNSRNWVQHLESYAQSINIQTPARSKFSPEQLYQTGYVPPAPPNNIVNFNRRINDTSTRAERENYVKAALIKRLSRQMIKDTKTSPNSNFQVGDYVRVKLLALISAMRRRKKETFDEKLSAIKYSLYLYRIHSVVPATTFDNQKLPVPNIWSIRRFQYVLENLAGVIIRNEVPDRPARAAMVHMGVPLPGHGAVAAHFTTPRLFWGSDLIHAASPATQVLSHVQINTARIFYINDLN